MVFRFGWQRGTGAEPLAASMDAGIDSATGRQPFFAISPTGFGNSVATMQLFRTFLALPIDSREPSGSTSLFSSNLMD